MKRVLFTLGLIIITLASFAQDFWSGGSEMKITYGLIATANINFPQLKSDGAIVDPVNPFPISADFGINADFKFNDYFSIRPGIVYMGRSAEVNDDNFLTSVNQKYNFYYLEVPLDFIGHIPFYSGANIFLGGGPYLAKGMSASVKETIGNNDPVKEKLTYGSNGDLKPMDYGITTVLGFQAAKGWSVGLNFDIGGTNIIQNGDASNSLKVNTLYFDVGLSF